MEFNIRSPGDSIEQTSDETIDREYEGIRTGVAERGDAVRRRMGNRLFDFLIEHFPEEYAARRRSELGRAFGVGIIVGFVAARIISGDRR